MSGQPNDELTNSPWLQFIIKQQQMLLLIYNIIFAKFKNQIYKKIFSVCHEKNA